ncbi:MAG: M23 family metallopeptidase, partial [Bellilinea sp.]
MKHILTLLLSLTAAYLLTAADNPPPMLASDETEAELSVAFFDRLNDSAALQSLTFDLFTPEVDVAFTSSDGQKAVLWLALRDNTGRLLATEPGLAMATLTDEGWQVLLPGDQGWEETLAALPQGMLPLELSPAPESVDLSLSVVTDALTGYYLPYAAGTARWLEGSISHFQSIPELGYPSCDVQYCRYAYDFTDTWHFPLVASRDGKVVASRDTCSDGNPYCTNFIVLRDTSGQTFQIYLHLAQGTIPDKLTPDTEVLRGQYLGDSDDTGYSTSNHVHFMVTDSLWTGGDGYYWGTSID